MPSTMLETIHISFHQFLKITAHGVSVHSCGWEVGLQMFKLL